MCGKEFQPPVSLKLILCSGFFSNCKESGMRLVGQTFVLLEDDNTKLTGTLCENYIKSKDEQHVLQLMSWPVQSANLNPIELVWAELDRKVRAKQPLSWVQLEQRLKESWTELSSVYFQSVVKRMLRICAAMIATEMVGWLAGWLNLMAYQPL